MNKKIAVLIPCFNEEITIASVVEKFRKNLPEAFIYVFDNNSTDTTAQVAAAKGAIVIRETKQGKGNVVSSMFRKINADIYVMVDGDDTYCSEKVHDLIQPIVDGEADMVVGIRTTNVPHKVYRRFHVFGNNIVNSIIKWIFKSDLKDIMSGYRVFSRELVSSLPLLSKGFEIETEITLQALYHNFTIKEIESPYKARPSGSYSKVNTIKDGVKVLFTILCIFKDFKPLTFFGSIGIILFISSFCTGIIAIREYAMYGLIHNISAAILFVGLSIAGLLFIFLGILLTTINTRFREVYTILQRGKIF